MKKLMLTAALMASAAAFAADCTPTVVTPDAPTLVYQFKASVKTTKGVTGSVTTDTSTICTPGQVTTDTTILRAKDSTTWAGWIYDCEATCDTIKNGTAVLWDSKRKGQIVDAAFTWNLLQILKGGSVSEAEWDLAGTATYDETRTQAIKVTGAGFGTYSAKKGFYTAFSGYFAGTMGASFDMTKKTTCEPSQVVECTDLTALVDKDTIAYGNWSIKYNASASKKYVNGVLTVPAYVSLNP